MKKSLKRSPDPEKILERFVLKLRAMSNLWDCYEPETIKEPESEDSLLEVLERKGINREKAKKFLEEVKMPFLFFRAFLYDKDCGRLSRSDFLDRGKKIIYDLKRALKWIDLLAHPDLQMKIFVFPTEDQNNKIQDKSLDVSILLSEIIEKIESNLKTMSRKRGQKDKPDESGFVFQLANLYQKFIGEPSTTLNGAFYLTVCSLLAYAGVKSKAPDRAIQMALRKLNSSK